MLKLTALAAQSFNYPERVIYLTDKARQACRCTLIVREGGCHISQQGNTLPQGKYLFVLDTTGLYVLKEMSATDEKGITYHYKHTSLSRGAPVLSAGEIDLDEGEKLVTIGMLSGHYYPDQPELKELLDFLSSHGVAVEQIKILPIPKKHKTVKSSTNSPAGNLAGIVLGTHEKI